MLNGHRDARCYVIKNLHPGKKKSLCVAPTTQPQLNLLNMACPDDTFIISLLRSVNYTTI